MISSLLKCRCTSANMLSLIWSGPVMMSST